MIMAPSSNFQERVIQLTDALDRFDAVSNQVLALDGMLRELELRTAIYSRWAHPEREDRRLHRDTLRTDERDVLIVHYYGYSDGLETWLADQYCTKILLYHNITPHDYFEDPTAHDFCRKGREQLAAILGQFSFFWGDSQYNLDELIALGADRERSHVVPIMVASRSDAARADVAPRPGQWVFVGRAAPNKGVVALIELFACMRQADPALAEQLVVVGAYDPAGDPYGQRIARTIAVSGCSDCIRFTGKIADEERDRVLAGSAVYVSLSEHEGFGVPLIEAAHYDLPVVALGRAAVGETLAGHGVSATLDEVKSHIARLARDERARAALLTAQQANAVRFGERSVRRALTTALAAVVPAKDRFRTVSVVVCTYNRRDYLERCLDYLTYQSRGDFEVVVVNGPSDDGTAELLERYRGVVKIVDNPECNLSKSRNLGIDRAAGDIVAFIDDDALPFDDWIDRMLTAYNGRPLTTVGLGGPAYYAGTFWFQAEDNGIDADGQAKVNIASDEIGRGGWLRYNTGTNATFTRAALEQADGFDEQYDYFLDESELCFRLQQRGGVIGYDPEVLVRHEFAQSHNRGGKLNYNWFTICKNTAYFIATHGHRRGKAAKEFIEQRARDERIKPLDEAVAAGTLTVAERDAHVAAIGQGIARGLADAKAWPKTRPIAPRPADFRRYPVRTDRLAVGRDIAPLHICIVSKEAPPFAGSGGVGTLYYHLASELLLMGHHVSLLVPGMEEKTHRQGRFAVYFTPAQSFPLPPMDGGFAGNVEWSLTAMARLGAIHKERPIDIVDGALWDAETLAFALIDRAKRPPLVVRLVTPYAISAEHNQWHPSPDQLALFMAGERSLIERADAVIPISDVIARSIIAKYGVTSDDRWSTGHCGIAPWAAFDVNEDYGAFPELGGVDTARLQSSKLVVFVGRLELRKGIDLILDAALDMLAGDPAAVLVLAGRDPDNMAQKFRNRLGKSAAERLVALGEVSNATREKLLAHAYCVLFPSRYESFGLVPLEAFVHGVPVVANNAGAIPEVVRDGECGILFDGTAAGLAAGVKRLLGDPALRQAMSVKARERVNELSARRSALHSIEVYAKLLNPARGARRCQDAA